MSELKAYTFSAMERIGLADYYLKSEADKVIVELKGQVNGFKNRSNLWYYNAVEEHKKFVQVDQQITELKTQKAQAEDDCAYWKTMAQKNAADNAVMAKQRAEALKRESRQKYKRCLAMARWCDTKADWYYGIGMSFRDRVEFYIKWHKRWLELAEEPTWAKFLQLIHKEAK